MGGEEEGATGCPKYCDLEAFQLFSLPENLSQCHSALLAIQLPYFRQLFVSDFDAETIFRVNEHHPPNWYCREFLELRRIEAIAANNKIYYGSNIPNVFLPTDSVTTTNKPWVMLFIYVAVICEWAVVILADIPFSGLLWNLVGNSTSALLIVIRDRRNEEVYGNVDLWWGFSETAGNSYSWAFQFFVWLTPRTSSTGAANSGSDIWGCLACLQMKSFANRVN